MSAAIRFGFVILNYRNYADTIECVRSLERTDASDATIYIIDNDSQNGSEEALRDAFGDRHRVMQSGSNLGYAGGNNVGLRAALDDGCDWIVILNNDTLVAQDFVATLLDFVQQDETVGVVGAQIEDENGQPDRMAARRIPPLMEIFWNRGIGKILGRSRALERQAYYDAPHRWTVPTEVDIVSGSCMALRAEMLQEIGLLDDATILFWEEFILASKVAASRFRSVVVPSLRVVHKGGQSVKTVGERASRAYMQSLDHYLAHYRGCGWLRRRLICAGPALFFAAGRLKRRLFGARR